VFENMAFQRNANDAQLLNRNFFGREFFHLYEEKIRCLKLCDFFRDGRMVPQRELIREWTAGFTGPVATPTICRNVGMEPVF
jgi:hypothetical protein